MPISSLVAPSVNQMPFWRNDVWMPETPSAATHLADPADPTSFFNQGPVPSGAWIQVGSGGGAAAFNTGWGNLGGGFHNVAYRRRSDGLAEIRGVPTRSSGSSAVIFTLPSGWRPANEQYYPVVNSGPGRSVILIQASGAVSTLNIGGGGNYLIPIMYCIAFVRGY